MSDNCYRLAYVVQQHLPAGGEQYRRKDQAMYETLRTMTPGRMHSLLHSSSGGGGEAYRLRELTRQCTIGSVVRPGRPLLVGTHTYFQKLSKARERKSDLLKLREEAVSYETLNDSSLFSSIESRITSLREETFGHHKMWLAQNGARYQMGQVGSLANLMMGDEIAQRGIAEATDIAELLFAYGLLMIRPIDGTDQSSLDLFRSVYGEGKESELKSVMQDASETLYMLHTIAKIPAKDLTEANTYLTIRSISFKNAKGTGPANMMDHLLSLVRKLKSYSNKLFVVSEKVGDSASKRVFKPKSYYSLPRDFSTYSSLLGEGGGDDLVMGDFLKAGDGSADSCPELCEAGIEGLYSNKLEAHKACNVMICPGPFPGNERTNSCIEDNIKKVQREGGSTVEKIRKLKALVMQYAETDCPYEHQRKVCEQRVEKTLSEKDVPWQGAFATEKEFVYDVCDRSNPVYESFSSCKNPNTGMQDLSSDASCLSKYAIQKREEGGMVSDCKSVLQTCDSPLTCYIASTEEGWKSLGNDPKFALVHSKCKGVRESGMDFSSLSGSADESPCEKARKVLTSNANRSNSKSYDTLLRLYKNACGTGDLVNMKTVDARTAISQVNKLWNIATTQDGRLKQDQQITFRTYKDIEDSIMGSDTTYNTGGDSNGIQALLRAIDLSCIPLRNKSEFEPMDGTVVNEVKRTEWFGSVTGGEGLKFVERIASMLYVRAIILYVTRFGFSVFQETDMTQALGNVRKALAEVSLFENKPSRKDLMNKLNFYDPTFLSFFADELKKVFDGEKEKLEKDARRLYRVTAFVSDVVKEIKSDPKEETEKEKRNAISRCCDRLQQTKQETIQWRFWSQNFMMILLGMKFPVEGIFNTFKSEASKAELALAVSLNGNETVKNTVLSQNLLEVYLEKSVDNINKNKNSVLDACKKSGLVDQNSSILPTRNSKDKKKNPDKTTTWKDILKYSIAAAAGAGLTVSTFPAFTALTAATLGAETGFVTASVFDTFKNWWSEKKNEENSIKNVRSVLQALFVQMDSVFFFLEHTEFTDYRIDRKTEIENFQQNLNLDVKDNRLSKVKQLAGNEFDMKKIQINCKQDGIDYSIQVNQTSVGNDLKFRNVVFMDFDASDTAPATDNCTTLDEFKEENSNKEKTDENKRNLIDYCIQHEENEEKTKGKKTLINERITFAREKLILYAEAYSSLKKAGEMVENEFKENSKEKDMYVNFAAKFLFDGFGYDSNDNIVWEASSKVMKEDYFQLFPEDKL